MIHSVPIHIYADIAIEICYNGGCLHDSAGLTLLHTDVNIFQLHKILFSQALRHAVQFMA
jgi:hypothetical protein